MLTWNILQYKLILFGIYLFTIDERILRYQAISQLGNIREIIKLGNLHPRSKKLNTTMWLG